MVYIEDNQGRGLLKLLLAAHPEWEDYVVDGGPDHEAAPRLLIPSEHPIIRTPLQIVLADYLPLHWNGHYFCDFIGIDRPRCTEAAAFIEDFLAERVYCSIRWRGDQVAGGGPIYVSEWKEWPIQEGRMELRTWRGTYDRDVYPA